MNPTGGGFLRGTMIATPAGERAIEDLAVGDDVLMASGSVRPVRWIGRRQYSRTFSRDDAARPVTVMAGALAPDSPLRALRLAPDLAILLDKVLVPVGLLINGRSILQAEGSRPAGPDLIEYLHLEFDRHDILRADGAEAETYVDRGDRAMFRDHAGQESGSGREFVLCAPRIENGPKLEAIRERLATRAALSPSVVEVDEQVSITVASVDALMDAAPKGLGAVNGHLDGASRELVNGWAWVPSDPDRALTIEVAIDGTVAGRTVADRRRDDVRLAGFGHGRCGFEFELPALSPFEAHEVAVRVVGSDAVLAGSPRTIEAVPHVTQSAVAGFAHAVRHLGGSGPAPLDDAIRLLTDQAEVLRRARRTEPPDDRRALALVIDDRLPTIDRDAGSQAIVSHARALTRLGYRVVFVPANLEIARNAASLDGPHVTIATVPQYRSVEEILRAHGADVSLIYLHRHVNMIRFGALARRYCPAARLLLNVADLHYLRIAREAQVTADEARLAESRVVHEREMFAIGLADLVVTHSAHEAELLARVVPEGRLHVVPWDVAQGRISAPFDAREGVIFIGGADHTPNVDAARFLVGPVMTRVHASDPSITCTLVGEGLERALGNAMAPGCTAVGHVPDLWEAMNDVRLSAAPVRFGAGVKGKVLQSMAAGLPCVTTSVGSEGLSLPASLKGTVADSAEGLAAAILRLHGDETANARAATASAAFAARHAGAGAVDRALGTALGVKVKRKRMATAG